MVYVNGIKCEYIGKYETNHPKSIYNKYGFKVPKEAIKNVAVTIIRFKAGHDFANTVKLTTEKGYYQFKKLER
jgi:hypothetical protein